MIDTRLIDDEVAIVWNRDVSNLDYVRQISVMCNSRSKKIKGQPEWIELGYSVLKPQSLPDHKYNKSSYWDRRLFYITNNDPYTQHCPVEAVDPITIQPGFAGTQTTRCLGMHHEINE